MKPKNPFHIDGVHYWHGSEFLLLATIASKRCQPGQFSLEAQTAQVMSAVAAEAFIDQMATSLANLNRLGKADRLARIGSILQTLEASRVQVTEKYSIASQLLPGKPFAAGEQPFQSFRMLITLRNFLVHPKSEANPPGWFSFFASNKLTVQTGSEEHVLPDWQQQLQSSQCATWACRASSRIILEVIERLREPSYAENVPGIYEVLNREWSWARTDERIWPSDSSDGI